PMIAFIIIIMRKPGLLHIDNRFFKTHEPHTIDDRYNLARNQKQQELDRILEKIHNKGMKSLTQKEKDFLKRSS
ncbi:MAG TPA: DUF6576 domain-containing protein, partial [Chitinophagaceae bacterium]|nr:DUF6576 domain-containing protein [Chitinophagaceae bacterium]